jgi:sugar lactone lactonase YvrE
MAWTLIKELGIDYAPVEPARNGERLRYPAFAERGDDGTYMIIDELGQEKVVPIRAECRTLQVNNDGKALFDSSGAGFEDAYGKLLDDGHLALLRRTLWELWIVSFEGTVRDRIRLSCFSKRMPRSFWLSQRGTFLVVFVDRVFEVDIVEIDRQGRLLWYLPPGALRFGCPSSVQLLPSGNLLVADEFCHAVTEVDPLGTPVWQYGERDNPSAQNGYLCGPKSACQGPDGSRLIVDARNHRVIRLDPAGRSTDVRLPDGDFCSPSYGEVLPDGQLLICDAGNQRVVELDPEGTVSWEYGQRIGHRRWFSFPRSVETSDGGKILVCDTAQNRVVEIRNGQVRNLPFHGEPGLFWPRSARGTSCGTVLIADGRNSRVVEIDLAGNPVRELHTLDSGLHLGDPHEVRLLPDDHLLITDPWHHLVIEANWAGRIYRVVGATDRVKLKDPHSAQQLPDGSLVIADTGQSRVLVVAAGGEIAREWVTIQSGPALLRLNQPRYAEVSPEGDLVVVDTGNNRVLAADARGDLLWELTTVPTSRLPSLNQPRWAQLLGRKELLVCDHYNHRILHLRFNAASPKAGGTS